MNVTAVARDKLVEHMQDGIAVTDLEGRIIDLNPALLKMKGISKKNTTGKPLKEVWPELFQIANEMIYDQQHEFIFEAGSSQRYLDFVLTPLFDKSKKVAGKMLVLRDVTTHHQMERTIKESEKRYSTLVEQSNDGVLIIIDQKIKYSNLTFASMSGYSLKELMDMPVSNLLPCKEKLLIAEMIHRVREGKPISRSFELHLICKDGTIKDGDISTSLITLENSIAV